MLVMKTTFLETQVTYHNENLFKQNREYLDEF